MIALILTLAVSAGPTLSCVVQDHCDVIEDNSYYDREGRQSFRQLIFWDWCEADECYHVVAWRMLTRERGRSTTRKSMIGRLSNRATDEDWEMENRLAQIEDGHYQGIIPPRRAFAKRGKPASN